MYYTHTQTMYSKTDTMHASYECGEHGSVKGALQLGLYTILP